jgi:Tol biopolymer transport system component/predicted Ser/Thr protein kinase
MGEVYRARDGRLERDVAIKVLPAELVSDAARVARFLQEARAASALNHPHVIAVYDIGEADSLRFIAMELVDGSTLRDLTAAGPLDRRKAVKIVLQVAEALTAAHAAGIIHRDLKPENVMVTASGYAKVLDFGLAKLRIRETGPNDPTQTLVKETDPGTVMGTVGYMSPEQALGKVVDPRSDLFSLGCILYELVSGQRAFRGSSSVDTLHRIVHGEPQPLRDLLGDAPPELVRIVRKALAKDPDERYQTARDMAIDLRDLLRELESNPSGSVSPVSGTAAIAQSVAQPSRTAPRAALWIGALLLVGAIAAAAFYALRARTTASAPVAAVEPPRMTRLTASGKVIAATVSSDGKFIAYVSSDQGLQSLWLRQIDASQNLELVKPQSTGYWGLAFAPDGSIVYGLKSQDQPGGAFYQIPVLGGEPRKILAGIDSGPTFSPDGKQLAFLRGRHPSDDKSSVIVANIDGSGERTLASVQSPEYFVPIFYAGPSWSPDGTQIAAAIVNRQRQVGRIAGIDAKSGAMRTIAEGPWDVVSHVEWTPEGDALLAIGQTSRGDQRNQVWFVPYPTGAPSQITNDLFDYRMVSITGDGKSFVTVASDANSDLWIHREGSAPKKLTSAKMEGALGVAPLPDGRIVTTSLESGKMDLWLMNADGSGRTLLTRDANDNRNPVLTPDGRFIVYVSIATDGIFICRMNLDGSERRVLARRQGPETRLSISPDGKYVLYATSSPTGKNHSVLARVPVDGGAPRYLTDYPADAPSYSPDGTRIAAYSHPHIVILPSEGGAPLQKLEGTASFVFLRILWAADGRSLLVNAMPRDRANLWQVPLDGSAPRKLTDFDERMMMSFARLPDGKGWIFARGDLSRDAVLIRGWRGAARR